jgi:hypothetical protein
MAGFAPYPVAVVAPALLATTTLSGFVLQNATPNIFTWTAPNDGKLHMIFLSALTVVTSAETGGAWGINLTEADNTVRTPGLSAGSLGTGATRSFTSYMIQPNTVVTVEQTSALTVGAATVWAELWGY